MSKVKNGDKVKIHYTGKLKDGEIFDTSREKQPLEFIVGNREMMPGLETRVIGMEAGKKSLLKSHPKRHMDRDRKN
jgi:FKBP-type peptidyl-prolyl cis-trans isomerase 2